MYTLYYYVKFTLHGQKLVIHHLQHPLYKGCYVLHHYQKNQKILLTQSTCQNYQILVHYNRP